MINQEPSVSLINEINEIPIFDVMDVKGYCIVYDSQIKTFVFAADIAREGGLIFDQEQTNCATSGTITYKKIRWNRFNEYVNDSIEYYKKVAPDVLAWLQLPIHAYSYIPLEIALTVLMYCKSDKAKQFQVKLSAIIAPTITNNALRVYEAKFEEYQKTIAYYKDFIDSSGLYSSTEIAKEFCLSAVLLHKLLHKLKIIYPINGTWAPYKPFDELGYTQVKALYANGETKHGMFWTEAGRRFVIDLLLHYQFVKGQNNDARCGYLLTVDK